MKRSILIELRLILLVIFSLSIFSVNASEPAFTDKHSTTRKLSVLDGWIRLTPPVAKNGAAYFVLYNAGQEEITIVDVKTPLAETVAMHDAVIRKGMIRMKHLSMLTVPAGARVAFAPGGKHLMLINLTETLKAGKEFPVNFTLKNGETVSAVMVVR